MKGVCAEVRLICVCQNGGSNFLCRYKIQIPESWKCPAESGASIVPLPESSLQSQISSAVPSVLSPYPQAPIPAHLSASRNAWRERRTWIPAYPYFPELSHLFLQF